MDGPSVNFKFLREMKALLMNASDNPEFFDIGTCSLLVANGGYKTAYNAVWRSCFLAVLVLLI